jgi:hypothetical protein
MKKFELKSKCGEVINKTNATSVSEAIEVFAKIKKLTIHSLLEIFLVVEDTEK